MFWRLIVALIGLLFMRIFFASARRVANRGTSASGNPKGPVVGGPRRAGSRGRASRKRATPRIDRSAAEDVPFVEVKTEGAARD